MTINVLYLGFQVYDLAPRERELMNLVHSHCSSSLILVFLMIATMAVFIFSYSFIMLTVAKREMHRYTTLIEQREKTEQAERKSMRKSDAFAKASHDIRAALAGIISWINFCKEDIHDALDLHATDGRSTRHSEIETVLTKIDSNLKRLDVHAEDLLGKYISILIFWSPFYNVKFELAYNFSYAHYSSLTNTRITC